MPRLTKWSKELFRLSCNCSISIGFFLESVGRTALTAPLQKALVCLSKKDDKPSVPRCFCSTGQIVLSSGFLGLICFCVNLPDSLELSERYLTDTKADVPIRYLLLLFRLYLYCFLLSYYLSQHTVPLFSEQSDAALRVEVFQLPSYRIHLYSNEE